MDRYFLNLFDVSDVDVDLFIERELEETIQLSDRDIIFIDCWDDEDDTQVDIPCSMYNLINHELVLR